MKPNITISCGDVNGVGLRCFAEACLLRAFNASIELMIDSSTLEAAIVACKLPGILHDSVWKLGLNDVRIVPVEAPSEVHPGTVRDDAARCAVASLEACIELISSDERDALVTLPINKYALSQVGWPFPGQTEMVAASAQGTPLMVLCTRDVRVALATVHVALSKVAETLTVERITDCIAALKHHLVADLGVISPLIAVLAVDPHAGESGVIGTIDTDVVAPAIALARASELDVHGPFPADGFFAFGAYQKYDGIVAMYHDQGLIPLKLLAKGAGVNVTAGLSVVRTSPDHGTAYDIAARGDVDPASTIEAIEMAISIARNRRSLQTA
jgi:4-hydroxythreonine-4-phosphate dehydrogenase